MKHNRRRFLLGALFVALFSLAGCQEFQQLSSAVVENRRAMNDAQAQLTLDATCDLSIGAYHRRLNREQQQGIDLLCDPNAILMGDERAVSVPRNLPTWLEGR